VLKRSVVAILVKFIKFIFKFYHFACELNLVLGQNISYNDIVSYKYLSKILHIIYCSILPWWCLDLVYVLAMICYNMCILLRVNMCETFRMVAASKTA